MSDDDWEGWEDKEVELPNVKAPVGMTATEALTKAGGYDASKFEGEDEEEDSPKYVVPESQPKKERVSKYAHKENMGVQKYVGDVTDKLAQQRLQQEAELGTIAETFGAGREVNELDRFIPVKKEDYKKFGKMVAQQYVVVQHGKPGAHYKVLIKSLMREVAEPCTASDLRDLETEVAKLRKEKEEKERKEKEKMEASKKSTKKKGVGLRVERDDLTAGLEGDTYAHLDDIDDDFM